jgi:hypothetical protein
LKLKILAVTVIASLLISVASSLHHSEAQVYENQANFKYVKEKIVEPIPGKTGWWKYLLKVCADDYSLAIAEVILSSDTEKIYQGVNKAIPKGECSFYGAVMKAKNGNTLGYKIIQTHEAVQKIMDSKQGKLTNTNWAEISRYKFITGFY